MVQSVRQISRAWRKASYKPELGIFEMTAEQASVAIPQWQ